MRQGAGFKQSPSADDAVIARPSAFHEPVVGRVDRQRKIERDLPGFKMLYNIARKPDFLPPMPRTTLVMGYKGTNMFNEEMTGRVDEDGNVYRGSNIFTEEKTGRVDADGNVFKGSNVFTEEKVGRVDSEGNAFKGTNVFTEEKVGRIERKDG